jgi:CBS domain-containing protein
MEEPMKTSEIMTRAVISATPATSIAEAARLMLQHRVSGLPVVDPKGEVVGIITEGDLLRRAETGAATHHPRWLEFLLGPGRLAAEYTRAHARQVGEVMTRDIVSVHSETEVADLVQLMNKRRIKRVPVIDAGKPVGIVSRANLVRALVKALVKKPGGAVGDDKIWNQSSMRSARSRGGRGSRSISPSRTASSSSTGRLPMNASGSPCRC